MGDGDERSKVSTTRVDLVLPEFPGEEFFAHAAEDWLEQAQARMAPGGMLAVAQGHEPPACKVIIDVDLSSLPPLPPDARDFYRRQEAILSAQRQNAINAQKRLQITLDMWTAIWMALKICSEKTAPVFSRQLKDSTPPIKVGLGPCPPKRRQGELLSE